LLRRFSSAARTLCESMQRVGLALPEQNIIMPPLNIINLCPIKSIFLTLPCAMENNAPEHP